VDALLHRFFDTSVSGSTLDASADPS
jgi:hypothetical protein